MTKITDYLPTNWETQAKELGAMQCSRGVIRNAKLLLRLNMLYTTNNGSFQMAALGMALTEGVTISKNSVAKRIRNSGEWLRWMAMECCFLMPQMKPPKVRTRTLGGYIIFLTCLGLVVIRWN